MILRWSKNVMLGCYDLKMDLTLLEENSCAIRGQVAYFLSHGGGRNWVLFFLQGLLLIIRLGRTSGFCLWMGTFMSRLKQFLSVHVFNRDCLFQAQTLLFPQKLPAIRVLAEWLIMSWSLNIFQYFDSVLGRV